MGGGGGGGTENRCAKMRDGKAEPLTPSMRNFNGRGGTGGGVFLLVPQDGHGGQLPKFSAGIFTCSLLNHIYFPFQVSTKYVMIASN
jgi:hypothetical protein